MEKEKLQGKNLGIKGFKEPIAREALKIILNALVKARIKHLPATYEETIGYLNAIGDVYLEFTKEKNFEFDEEIKDYLKELNPKR